ncbi:MAG: hypothetical protein JWP13_975 [Candidatus Saccharibacteria bacterium]|nr:hypothetical protein [Candidatus Saccharibacteria bacterium]
MKKARSFFALILLGLMVLSGGGAKVFAQSSNQGNGLKIAPVRTDLTIEKGGSRQVSLFVENITASTLTVGGVKNDFVSSDDESGEPRVILDDDKSAPGNSFKTLVGALPTVQLKPNERREIRVTLSVPKNAAAGGYYGAIRFAPGSGETDKNVSLTASVGTIFLIRVPGDIKEQLQVESFAIKGGNNTGSLFNSGPVNVVIRFKNSGNIHLQPFGKVTVKNFSGKVIDEFEINNTQPRGSVLPGSIRKFDYPVKEKKLFGRYTAEGSFGYGSNGELILAKKTFYVIPFKMIAAVIFVLAFLIFGLPRLIRAYNRSVIRRAGGQTTSRAKPKAKANQGSRQRRK